RRRHTISKRDWSSDVCSSDLFIALKLPHYKPKLPLLKPHRIQAQAGIQLLQYVKSHADGSPVNSPDKCYRWPLETKSIAAHKDRIIAQLFFNTQQLVVFSNTIRAAHRTGLDLPRSGCHSQIGNGGIFRFAGAMRNNGRVVSCVGHSNTIRRFSKLTDLVNLNKDGVSNALLNAPRQTFGIGNKKIIPYQLYTIPNGIGQLLPAVPVVFIQCISMDMMG